MQKMKLTKPDGYIVSCITEILEKPKGIVIAVHGFSSSKECPTFHVLREELTASGYGMIGIDLPGHGMEESAQEPLRIEGCENSVAAAEQYAAEIFPGVPVCYFASSFGAYITGLYISTREHVGRKAFFRSSAVNMPELFVKKNPTEEERRLLKDLETKGYFEAGIETDRPVRVTREFYHDLETTDLFRIFDPSKYGEHRIAMAHGSEDTIIWPDAARHFAEDFQIPITMFAGEGHSLSGTADIPHQVVDLAIRLFDEE